MKRVALLTTMALVLVVGVGSGIAQMKESGQQQPAAQQQQQNYPMMGPGMMGPGMMGYGMGPGGMMGPGMMGGYYGSYGCGMYQGLIGYGSGWEARCAKFLQETRELRKKLHELNFEYNETLQDPKNTIAQRTKLETEIFELQEKIREKAKEKE